LLVKEVTDVQAEFIVKIVVYRLSEGVCILETPYHFVAVLLAVKNLLAGSKEAGYEVKVAAYIHFHIGLIIMYPYTTPFPEKVKIKFLLIVVQVLT
jgi:hypothetical protein